MTMAMKTSEIRLAALFHQVGLIDESDWKRHFQKNARQSKRLVDVLWQDVSWQTFVDLATVEIRLPGTKSGHSLPVELTQPMQIRPDEILELLKKHKPDVRAFCQDLADAYGQISQSVSAFLNTLESDSGDPYERLFERQIVTPQLLSDVIQKGSHVAARRNRQRLALEILRLDGLISPETCDDLVERLDDPDFQLTGQLASRHGLTSERMAKAAGAEMTLPSVDLGRTTFEEAARAFCPVALLRRELCVPFEVNGVVRLAVSDPLNLSIADLIAIMTGRMVLPCYAPPAEIIAALNETFPPVAPQAAERRERQREVVTAPAPAEAPPPSDAPQKAAVPPHPVEAIPKIVDTMSTVQLVSSMIESAVATRATDIHLEPHAEGLRVRFRIDGQLHVVMHVPEHLALPVISRIKVLANMNVTERRRPQDGHFALDLENRRFDFRISTMPSHLGEKLVLRILDETTVLKGLSELGLSEEQEKLIHRLIDRPFGLLLVTGPTGSGKTTTLYSALSKMNRPGVNITTIEDPVEYQLEGITQVQVDYGIEMDFASGLRAALRQDPDVIMVGEIRDVETARIAIRAALTGHMVFSTLHTNTSVGAVAALFHMGIQPYLIASALAGVVAQRLVRTICKECPRAVAASKGLVRDLGLDEKKKHRVFRGKGCSACLNTGNWGRTGIFEVLRITEAIRALITEQASDEQLEQTARADDFRGLREHAIEKVLAGTVSPDEVLRTVLLGDS